MEPVREGGKLIEPNRPLPEVPPTEAPNGKLVALAVSKIEPLEPAPLVATDLKSPVLGFLALVKVAKTEIGLDFSAVTAEVVPTVTPPKMDVVDFGVAKEVHRKIFPEKSFGDAGLDGEQMMNEPKRFDVVSAVDVVGAVSDAVVIVAEDEVTESKRKPEEVVIVVVVVVTAEEDGTAGAVEMIVVVTCWDCSVAPLNKLFWSWNGLCGLQQVMGPEPVES